MRSSFCSHIVPIDVAFLCLLSVVLVYCAFGEHCCVMYVSTLPSLAAFSESARMEPQRVCRDRRCEMEHGFVGHGFDFYKWNPEKGLPDMLTQHFTKLATPGYKPFFVACKRGELTHEELLAQEVEGKSFCRSLDSVVAYSGDIYAPNRESSRQHVAVVLRSPQQLNNQHKLQEQDIQIAT